MSSALNTLPTESQWFWEKLHNSCTERALSLNLKLPNHIHNEAILKFPKAGKVGKREAEVRNLLEVATTANAPVLSRGRSANDLHADLRKVDIGKIKQLTSQSSSTTCSTNASPRPRSSSPSAKKSRPIPGVSQKVQEVFKKLDANCDGTISLAEFSKAFDSGVLSAPGASKLADQKATSFVGKLGGGKGLPPVDSEASTRIGSTVTSARSVVSTAPIYGMVNMSR